MEKDDSVHIKVRSDTRTKLRLIAAMTGDQMMDIADRLFQQELDRLKALETSEFSGK